MQNAQKTLLITGGAGFIGSHVVRLFVNQYPDYHIVNLDVLLLLNQKIFNYYAEVQQKLKYVN
jgi:dTDP-D-glucose 4,6-dehydratase